MPPRDLAARVRAAFAYKGLSKAERATVLGVSERHVTRIEAGEVAVDVDRLEAVAQATGVPLAFLRHGFGLEDPTLDERIEALEHQQRTAREESSEARRAAAAALAELAQTIARHTREIEELRSAGHQARPVEGNAR